MPLIQLEDIHKTYHLGEVPLHVLRGVTCDIQEGEFIALMGSSGSGKTTLMNILGCLDRPSAGRYKLAGDEVSELTPDGRANLRNSRIGFVFQNFNLLARTTALDNVLLPLNYSRHTITEAEARQRALSLLDRVGLSERIDHEPSKLSGGQQQRVAIARSLINQPSLLLADEPTGNLDSKTSVEILQMFQQLNREGLTIVLVTHDPGVGHYASRTIHMRDGLIVDEPIAAHA